MIESGGHQAINGEDLNGELDTPPPIFIGSPQLFVDGLFVLAKHS